MRFNKEGNLLVVTTADNGFKVLANASGLRALRAMEAQSCEASRTPLEMKVIPFIAILICFAFLYIMNFY